MGFYINPPSGTKEQWLRDNAIKITEAEAVRHAAGAKLVICLVNNGSFTAAGIAVDDHERDAFAREDDREKMWFLAETEALRRDRFLN